MNDRIFHATDANFEDIIVAAKVPVLLDFWAPWCGPCLALNPVIEQLAEDFEGKVKIVKIDVDECPKTRARFGVRGIPQLTLMNNGEIVTNINTIRTREGISKLLQAQIDEQHPQDLLRENLDNPAMRLEFLASATIEELEDMLDQFPEFLDSPISEDGETRPIIYFLSMKKQREFELFKSRGAKLSMLDLLRADLVDDFVARLEDNPDLAMHCDVDVNSPIVCAIEFGSQRAIDACLAAGVDFDEVAKAGAHELYNAIISAELRDEGILSMLVENGLDASIPTKDGLNLYHYAAVHRQSDLVETLLQHGIGP